MRHRWAIAGAALTAIALLGSVSFASAATPDPDPTQQAIDEQLAKVPGGVQISPHEVSYNDGNVIMVFPDSSGLIPQTPATRAEKAAPGAAAAATSYPYGCPSGFTQKWYCFYEGADFKGRMLQFKDCSEGGHYQYFSDYAFENKTSSWVNAKTDTLLTVYRGDKALWRESAASASSSVAADDQATEFQAFC